MTNKKGIKIMDKIAEVYSSPEIAIIEAVSKAQEGYIIDPDTPPYQVGFRWFVSMIKHEDSKIKK